MDKSEIKALLEQSVAKVTEVLPSLDKASLVELQAQETTGSNRSTLLTAIDAALSALDDDHTPPEGRQGAVVEPAQGSAGKILPTDYRHPDYAGPLSGEQAAWRVAHIKPVHEVHAK